MINKAHASHLPSSRITKRSSSIFSLSPARSGFTIVELLIVIVVIAILAAISIVAYRGIQDRANDSSARSAARQAATKLQVAFAENDTYPASLSSIGITNAGSTTYQYKYNNTVSPSTFCVTATTNNKSYYVSNTTTTPTEGGCSGHGVGGVEAISNIITNPSFETNTTGWTRNGLNGTVSHESDGGFSGSRYYRYVATTTATASNVGIYTQVLNLNATSSYRATAYVRGNANVPLKLHAELRNSTGGSLGTIIGTPSPASTGWTRISIEVPPTSSLSRLTLCIYSGSHSWTPGNQFDIDAVMFTEGTALPAYADGNSPNWDWGDVPNNSISTGPAL